MILSHTNSRVNREEGRPEGDPNIIHFCSYSGKEISTRDSSPLSLPFLSYFPFILSFHASLFLGTQIHAQRLPSFPCFLFDLQKHSIFTLFFYIAIEMF